IMSCGNEFVKTLKKIGYPKADELNGEDFDWLFESEEDRSFLEWFCGNINEQHVISEKELQDFNNLLESGKPILEGDALDEVLKTCSSADSKSNSQREEEEKEERKRLEDELQALEKMKNLTIHRSKKLQMMSSKTSQISQALKDAEEEALKEMKEGLGALTAANSKLHSELLSFFDEVKKLTSFLTASESENGPHPVFFSQLSLDKYLAQEEQRTLAIASYAKKHFSQGASELAENSHDENSQLGSKSKQVTCNEANVVCEESRELVRLQTAYICAQHQLIQSKAEEESIKSAIQCAEKILHSLKTKGIEKETLDIEVSSLNDEISTLKKQIAKINNEDLPALLKENARQWIAPVVKAVFDRRIAQQDYYAARQDEIYHHLINQKASFDLIELAYEIELRKHKDLHCQFESLIEYLKQTSDELEQRLKVMSELDQPAQPRTTIDSKDDFSRRLYQLLEGESKKVELFKTYEGLQQMAQKLEEDCATVQDQLAASSQEQSLFLSKLNSDIDALCEALYCGGNQVLLSSQELTDQFQEIEAHLNELNKLTIDLLDDVKEKRIALESNKLLQMERKLYVYYLKDEDHLKKIVEELEQQSKAKTTALEDQSFTTS
ncbi:HAUS3 protein, partial [Nothoprocta ornata]|nr:HAUS3 protein [Nothoprocta ornata]